MPGEKDAMMRHSTRRIRAALLATALLFTGRTNGASANCNVIPGATDSFRGALGAADRPFATPGDIVEVSLQPGICDAETTAFVEQPGGATRADDYRVTLVFTPQQGAKSAVVLATDCSQLAPGSPAVNACNAQLAGGTTTCIQANTPGNPNALSVADALHLAFRFPDTDALVGSASDDRTLAGPVKIAVTPSNAGLPCEVATQRCADVLAGKAACIDEIYAQDGTCRTDSAQRDTTFSEFTALPPPNDIDQLVNTPGATEAHFTVDAAGNLLLPMDYRQILVRVNGRPFPRLTRGITSIDAFASIAAPIRIPSRSFLSSWSPEGIRLPPVFEPLADPTTLNETTLFGSVDAPLGVIRIGKRAPVLAKCVGGTKPGMPCDSQAICSGGGTCTALTTPEFRECTVSPPHVPCASNDDCVAASAGICSATVCYAGPTPTATPCTTDAQCASGQLCGPSLFDFADRSGPGPVVVPPGSYGADVEQPVTLEGTKQSQSLLSFVVPEPIEGLSRNGDVDATDPVVVLRDRVTGLEQAIGPSSAEGRAVSTTFETPFQFSDVAVEDDLVAFSEPEVLQGNCTTPIDCDQNGDKDVFDQLLRVYRLGQSAPVYMTPQLPVDVAPVIDGKSLAISDGLVFFRTREADVATNVTGHPSASTTSGNPGVAYRRRSLGDRCSDRIHLGSEQSRGRRHQRLPGRLRPQRERRRPREREHERDAGERALARPRDLGQRRLRRLHLRGLQSRYRRHQRLCRCLRARPRQGPRRHLRCARPKFGVHDAHRPLDVRRAGDGRRRPRLGRHLGRGPPGRLRVPGHRIS